VAIMTADKLKLEKIKNEDETLKAEKEGVLAGSERLTERAKIAGAKQAADLARRSEKERSELSKEEPRLGKPKTESQTNLGIATKESQKKIEMATTEGVKAIQEAKREAPRELEKSKAVTQPDTKPKEDNVKIDAAKKDQGQGPPDEK
jgi:hypothetical protein